MPPDSQLILNAQQWTLPAVVVGVVALVLLGLGYGRKTMPLGRRILAAFLKALAFGLLLLALLDPLLTREQPKKGANLFTVLADDSAGLSISETDGAETRGAQLKKLLYNPTTSGPTAWLGKIAETFQLSSFTYSDKLRQVESFSALGFQGGASNTIASLESVGELHAAQPLAGILLLTDGIATDGAKIDDLAEDLPPIYPVVIGTAADLPDLGIGSVSVSQTPFEDAPVELQVSLDANGLNGTKPTVHITEIGPDAGENPIDEQQTVEIIDDSADLRFRLRPDGTGIHFLKIHASAPEGTTEATDQNNTFLVAVDRSGGPYRILYISGRPNWDFKFLRRALEVDPEIDLTALMRLARREPKFEWRGRNGENTNPLFRGFDGTDEDLRYDQPVLIRVDVEDETELRGGFPKVPEELFPKYHAIILDDLESAFFSLDQMELIRDFVGQRGGGLAMLGGVESFGGGDYARTPIGELLPVYPSAPGAGRKLLSIDFTREGLLEPWVRLRDNEAAEKSRLKGMPYFRAANPLGSIKPAASVLAITKTEDLDFIDEDHTRPPRPALSSQRYGDGRVAALAIADMWRWGLSSREAGEDLAKTWRQLVRWLVADAKGRVRCALPDGEPPLGQPLQIRIDALDESFLPMADALVRIEVQQLGDGSPAEIDPNLEEIEPLTAEPTTVLLNAEPSIDEPGTFTATYVPRQPGAYRISATATDPEGEPIGTAEAGWTINPAAAEFRSLQVDRAFLEALATRTGGKVLEPTALTTFANDLDSLEAPIMEIWSRPLWHTAWVFLAILICLLLEWALRRSGGMR